METQAVKVRLNRHDFFKFLYQVNNYFYKETLKTKHVHTCLEIVVTCDKDVLKLDVVL